MATDCRGKTQIGKDRCSQEGGPPRNPPKGGNNPFQKILMRLESGGKPAFLTALADYLSFSPKEKAGPEPGFV